MNSFLSNILLLFCLAISLSGQTKSNLEIINGLIDSSISRIEIGDINNAKTFTLQNNSPNEYLSLNERTISALVKKGILINRDISETNKINYSITQASVSYPTIFRDGILGDYLLERKVVLSGNYSIEVASLFSNADTFTYEITDTIKYSNISFVENSSVPFTKAKVPPTPLFPSLIEPIVAISAVAVTVILFFSVRSK